MSQTATEETTWQEYRPEDFGIGVAARQPGQEEDDELLHAAIQASKAQVLAEEACFKFVEGKDLHAVAADKSGNGPALNSIPQHAASHRAWFPPADTFVSEACPGGPTGQDAEQQGGEFWHAGARLQRHLHGRHGLPPWLLELHSHEQRNHLHE